MNGVPLEHRDGRAPVLPPVRAQGPVGVVAAHSCPFDVLKVGETAIVRELDRSPSRHLINGTGPP